MTMQHFDSDYMEGAHPRILQKLMKTNLDKMPGYGSDDCCRSAKEKIRAACGCPPGPGIFSGGRHPDQYGGNQGSCCAPMKG